MAKFGGRMQKKREKKRLRVCHSPMLQPPAFWLIVSGFFCFCFCFYFYFLFSLSLSLCLSLWQDSVHGPQILKRKENHVDSNRGPSAYQPNTIPLGQTLNVLIFIVWNVAAVFSYLTWSLFDCGRQGLIDIGFYIYIYYILWALSLGLSDTGLNTQALALDLWDIGLNALKFVCDSLGLLVGLNTLSFGCWSVRCMVKCSALEMWVCQM